MGKGGAAFEEKITACVRAWFIVVAVVDYTQVTTTTNGGNW